MKFYTTPSDQASTRLLEHPARDVSRQGSNSSARAQFILPKDEEYGINISKITVQYRTKMHGSYRFSKVKGQALGNRIIHENILVFLSKKPNFALVYNLIRLKKLKIYLA